MRISHRRSRHSFLFRSFYSRIIINFFSWSDTLLLSFTLSNLHETQANLLCRYNE